MDWSNDYLKPLLLGGPCCVGTPLGEELLTKAQELPLEPVFDEILPELLKTYAKWLPRRIQAFDADFGLFTTSLYELCSTIHPQTDFVFAQAHDFAKHATVHLQRRPLAYTPEMIVSRHVALSALFRIERKRTDLYWWGGQRTYYGSVPKQRIRFWNKGQEETKEDLWTLLLEQGDEENRSSRKALMEALLLRSPLTLMLAAGSQRPLTDLEVNPLLTRHASVTPFILWEDPVLARGVIDAWLHEGIFIASLRLSFWLLESLPSSKGHRASQQRCIEILIYLLWSTLRSGISASHDLPMQVAWESNRERMAAYQWSNEELDYWAVIARAFEAAEQRLPFEKLQQAHQDNYTNLLSNLKDERIQERKNELVDLNRLLTTE